MNASTVSGLTLKLVSLFLALVIWFIVSGPRRESMAERAVAAPLAFVRMPRELVITTEDLPETVNVRLRGRASEVRALSSQNLEVTVDVGWAQPGEAEITLGPKAINVQPGIEVMSIEPNKLRFRIEQLRQKAVLIRPFLVGNPPSGYVIGEASVQPDRALVSGPASQIRTVSEVTTERIIMTGRSGTFTQLVAVVSDRPLVRVLEPLSVQITVPVLGVVGPQFPEKQPTTTAGRSAARP